MRLDKAFYLKVVLDNDYLLSLGYKYGMWKNPIATLEANTPNCGVQNLSNLNYIYCWGRCLLVSQRRRPQAGLPSRAACAEVLLSRSAWLLVSRGLGWRHVARSSPGWRWSLLVCGCSAPFLWFVLGVLCERLSRFQERDHLLLFVNPYGCEDKTTSSVFYVLYLPCDNATGYFVTVVWLNIFPKSSVSVDPQILSENC